MTVQDAVDGRVHRRREFRVEELKVMVSEDVRCIRQICTYSLKCAFCSIALPLVNTQLILSCYGIDIPTSYALTPC